jgi:hypothetical protein
VGGGGEDSWASGQIDGNGINDPEPESTRKRQVRKPILSLFDAAMIGVTPHARCCALAHSRP